MVKTQIRSADACYNVDEYQQKGCTWCDSIYIKLYETQTGAWWQKQRSGCQETGRTGWDVGGGRGRGLQGDTETLLVVVGGFSVLTVVVIQRMYIYAKVTKLCTLNMCIYHMPIITYSLNVQNWKTGLWCVALWQWDLSNKNAVPLNQNSSLPKQHRNAGVQPFPSLRSLGHKNTKLTCFLTMILSWSCPSSACATCPTLPRSIPCFTEAQRDTSENFSNFFPVSYAWS